MLQIPTMHDRRENRWTMALRQEETPRKTGAVAAQLVKQEQQKRNDQRQTDGGLTSVVQDQRMMFQRRRLLQQRMMRPPQRTVLVRVFSKELQAVVERHSQAMLQKQHQASCSCV